MNFFPLLINGVDYDTKRYRYLPYADKSIIDPSGAMRMQREAQKEDFSLEIENCIFAKYCVADEDVIKTTINSAYNASLIFKNYSFRKRAKIIKEIHQLLLENKKNLIELMIIEGHPEKLAEWEFEGMKNVCPPETVDFFKSQLRGNYGQSNNEKIGWIRKPDGVVCVSPPGNAPCSNSLIACLALLGGNTLIVKPPLRLPVSTLYLWRNIIWEALRQNGAPPGTVNTIVGNSKLIMDIWLDSPLVNDIFFFGDSDFGMKIGVQAFQKGKKPILELSGNDLLIVWKDADITLAVESLIDGFMGSTQICMVPKKAIIHEEIYEQFEELFLEKSKQLKVGLASTPDVCLTPVGRIKDYFEFLNDAIDKGAEMLCGGKQVNYKGEEDQKGNFILPTVLRIEGEQQALEMRCFQEENFFPLIPLIKISADHNAKKDEMIFNTMISLTNENKYGLRTSVWANSNYYIAKFIKKLDRCGLLRVNSRHTGFSAYLPTHGGPGLSGGPFGELNYVWQKTTHLQGVSVTTQSKVYKI